MVKQANGWKGRVGQALRTWLVPSLLLVGATDAALAQSRDARLHEVLTRSQPAVIESLRQMVAIESWSSDTAGLLRMADYVEQRLRKLGGQVERRKALPGQADNVIARFSGTGRRNIMLLAHMDTVYPTGTLNTQPYKVDGDKVYGPGIADAKGGIAVILHSIEALHELGWRDYKQLTVLMNPDEEIGSRGSGELIATLAAEHDYVFSAEPSPDRPGEILLLGASGAGTVVMSVKGKSAHAGVAPEAGRNALMELAHQMLQTADVAQGIAGAKLNWTQAQGGQVRNQIPESAVGYADLRLASPQDATVIEQRLRERISKRLIADTEVQVEVLVGRPPYMASDAARELAKKGQQIYDEIGRKLFLVPNTGGGTDAGFAARSGKAVVLESFGLAGGGYHARDEYINATAIVPRLYLLTRMMQTVAAP